MNVDANLKRYFPLIVCAMIAVIAYFQVSAIGDLVMARMHGQADTSVPPLPQVGLEEPDAGVFRHDNPFGPATPDDAGGGDAGAPRCQSGRVLLIAKNDDPAWSFASIEDGPGKAQLRRIGDEVGGYRIEAFEWDRVILRSGSSRCELRMGDASPTPAGSARSASTLLTELGAQARRTGPNELHLPRKLVDELVASDEDLAGDVTLTPAKQGDKVSGLRLDGVRRGTLLNRLGLKNGDELVAVNGQPLTDPDKARAIHAELGKRDHVSLRLMRKGVPLTLEYTID